MSIEKLEEERVLLKGELQDVLGELLLIKEKIDAGKTKELERERREIGIRQQKIAFRLGEVRAEIKKIYIKSDSMEKRRAETIARAMTKKHIQWESFFIEAAREYLSGNEFEIISKRATSKQQIRNM